MQGTGLGTYESFLHALLLGLWGSDWTKKDLARSAYYISTEQDLKEQSCQGSLCS